MSVCQCHFFWFKCFLPSEVFEWLRQNICFGYRAHWNHTTRIRQRNRQHLNNTILQGVHSIVRLLSLFLSSVSLQAFFIHSHMFFLFLIFVELIYLESSTLLHCSCNSLSISLQCSRIMFLLAPMASCFIALIALTKVSRCFFFLGLPLSCLRLKIFRATELRFFKKKNC